MDSIRKYGSLALLLIAGLAIAFAQPLGLLALVLVQVINLAKTNATGTKLSKPLVMVAVFVVSSVIAWVQVDGKFPAFPTYGGELVAYLLLLYAWVQAVGLVIAPIMAAAIGLYNVVLERLLILIGDFVGLKLEPDSKPA